MEVIKVTRAEYEKIVRGEAVEKDGKIIQYDPIEEVHKPTKEQIKEALDAVKEYCLNHECGDCDLTVKGQCFFDFRTPATMKTEKIAEVIADAEIH